MLHLTEEITGLKNRKHQVIVHVDDRAANRYLVEKILTNAGYKVLQAETGNDGLRLVNEAKPDLVILDVHLPDISGFEVCRRLKADPETANISILQISSQLTNVDSRVEGLESGADAYLTEIRPSEIIATIKALLRAKAAEELAIAKAAEWSSTFNAVKDPILLIDSASQILQTNISAQTFLSTLNDDQLAALKNEFLIMLARQRNFENASGFQDIAVKNKVFRVSMDELSNASGKEKRYVLVLTDVTTLVEAESAIRRSNETLMIARDAAITASRAKSVFMSSMSHEFRTPLNAILGYAELMHDLAHERGDDVAAEDLKRIISSAQHLLSLISDVLDIARIEAGRASLNLSTVDVRELTSEVVNALKPIANQQHTEINLEIGENIDKITSDATKLRQILLNLLGNACKFTQHGKVTMRVLEDNDKDDKALKFVVTDTGIGICEEKLHIIFDAFEQGDNSQGTFGGTGLGLAISRRLAELLGGTLFATSELNIGSVFTLRLPLEQFHLSEPPVVAASS